VDNENSFISVKLECFEGPLDLLLHLIRKNEINIYDIPIAKITEEYIAAIEAMKEMNFDIAGEFLVMAATLIYIKSRMLLPVYKTDDDGEIESDVVDPREELVRLLVEYQKYQDAGKGLGERPILGRDVFKHAKYNVSTEERPLKNMEIFHLMSAYQKVFDRYRSQFSVHDVSLPGKSLQEKISELIEMYPEGFLNLPLEDIIQTPVTRNEVVVSFLCMLELAKLGFLKIVQVASSKDILLTTLKPLSMFDTSLISKAELAREAQERGEVMERNRAKSIISSLLFATEKPLTTSRITTVLEGEMDTNTVTEVLNEMKVEYLADEKLGFYLEEVADAWQLRTIDDNTSWVKKLENIKPIRISPAALEALAIIAYKQPVIKAEVDKIRGVDSSHLVKALMERNLIKISGRADFPGKPLLYSTTPEFLEIFGLKEINNLPSLTEIEELVTRTGSTGDFKELNNSLRLIVEETPNISLVSDDEMGNATVLDEMEELNKELRVDIDLVQEKVDILFEEACRKYANQRQRNYEAVTEPTAG